MPKLPSQRLLLLRREFGHVILVHRAIAAHNIIGHAFDPHGLGFLGPAVEVGLLLRHGSFVRLASEDLCRELQRMVWHTEVARCDS